jgi:hypothetical protein
LTRRRLLAALAAGVLALTALGLGAPPAAAATIDNGRIHAVTGVSLDPWANPEFGPGILHMWYPDWYPASGANLPGDVMWYGTYDYLATAPAGTATLATWRSPDTPANSTPEQDPGPGKWADDHSLTALSGGIETVIDATTFEVSFAGSRSTGAQFAVTLNYHALPGQRTIRVIATVSNTHPTAAFDFGYYHAEDLDAGGVIGADNDLNNDGNDAIDNTAPFDQTNGADDGLGDPGDTFDETLIPYTSPTWYTTWPGSALATSGWKGPGLGYITVADAGGQDFCDQGVTPANCGGVPDGIPDLYSGLVSFEQNIDWYAGRWDSAVYGPGHYEPGFITVGSYDTLCIDPRPPPPGGLSNVYPTYYAWEDIWECDQRYMDEPNHNLVNEDVGVGLLKHLGTIPAGNSRDFVFYIGEPPIGADLLVTGADITLLPDFGSTYVGTPVWINVTVHNGGTFDVVNDFPVAVYKNDPDADQDGVIDAGANLMASTTVPANLIQPFQPGETRTASMLWTPTLADVGAFVPYAVVDYQASGPFADGVIDEVDSNFYEILNNKAFYDTGLLPPGSGPPYATSPPYYEVFPPAANLELTAASITVYPDFGSAYAGNPQQLNATVFNTGSRDVTADFPVAFYKGDPDVDQDGLIDATAAQLGIVVVPASPGAPFVPATNRTASLNWTPMLSDVGTFTIYAVVDYQWLPPFTDGAVDERDGPQWEIQDNKAFYNTSGKPPGILPPFVTATPPDYQVFVPPVPGPPRNLRTHDAGDDILLTWELDAVSVADLYAVYLGTTPRGIDLTTPYATTPALYYYDPGAALVPGERYYVVRGLNSSANSQSATSNSAGAFTVPLDAGWNSISLPLDPFGPYGVADLRADTGALEVNYMDPAGNWVVYPGGANVSADVGFGYQVNLGSPNLHTFVGFPGSMILYDGGFGFSAANAGSLWADVLSPSGDVVLTWERPAGPVDHYCVWKSSTRDGFNAGTALLLACTPNNQPDTTTLTDPAAAAFAGEWYYQVVPMPAASGGGSTTWSIGVWSTQYDRTEAIGPPLKPAATLAVSDLTSSIPGALGILWPEGPLWVPHFTAMPADVYDAPYLQAVGYQITVSRPSVYTYVGT